VAQDLRDRLRGQLARSTRAARVIHQPLFSSEKQHAFTPAPPGRTTWGTRGRNVNQRIKTHRPTTVQPWVCKQAPIRRRSSDFFKPLVRRCSRWLLLFLLMGPDGLQDPFLLWELPGLQLRIDEIPVDRQLEATPARRNQFQIADLLLESRQQLARQTDGLRLIVSNRTVFQFHLHGHSFSFPTKRGNLKSGDW
jgi:hypothetical protein